jgi:hypothetical protein
MYIEPLTASLTTGALIAWVAISVRVGQCLWFAVDCF